VNCLGLLCVARYLLIRDFDVAIFIPSSYNSVSNRNVSHGSVLPVSFILMGLQLFFRSYNQWDSWVLPLRGGVMIYISWSMRIGMAEQFCQAALGYFKANVDLTSLVYF
jgi:hypothetical protein